MGAPDVSCLQRNKNPNGLKFERLICRDRVGFWEDPGKLAPLRGDGELASWRGKLAGEGCMPPRASDSGGRPFQAPLRWSFFGARNALPHHGSNAIPREAYPMPRGGVARTLILHCWFYFAPRKGNYLQTSRALRRLEIGCTRNSMVKKCNRKERLAVTPVAWGKTPERNQGGFS